MKAATLMFLALGLAGCGGGGGGGDSGGGGNFGQDDPVDNGDSNIGTVTLTTLYDRQPDIANCYEGELQDDEKQLALARLNDIRQQHGLKPVTYNYSDDVYTRKSALIIAANATLTHFPDEDSVCYSQEGALGSQTGNIHIRYSRGTPYTLEESDDSIVDFLIDEDVESLGHRRWLLDPFLSFVSYGRVDGAPVVDSDWERVTGISLKVINDEKAYIQDLLVDFVAYPYEDYPEEYFQHGWYLSFSVLFDKSDVWENLDVDFSAATITVLDEAGRNLTVHSVGYNNDGAGLPNFLKWKVDGTENDQRYRVTIRNVGVAGISMDYQYWFEIQ